MPAADVDMEVDAGHGKKSEGNDKEKFYLRYYVGHRGKQPLK